MERRPGRGDEREHLRPARHGVPRASTGSAPRRDPPTSSARYVTGDPRPGSATTTWPQPAELQRHRLRPRRHPGPRRRRDLDATQFDMREAFVKRYGHGGRALQQPVRRGRDAGPQVPGNRRWAQFSFDALLLMAAGAVSSSTTATRCSPRTPSASAGRTRRSCGRRSPSTAWARARRARARRRRPDAELRVPDARNAASRSSRCGDGKGRGAPALRRRLRGPRVPVADTDPATAARRHLRITPGRYAFVAVGTGSGTRGSRTRCGSAEPAGDDAAARTSPPPPTARPRPATASTTSR